MIDPPTGTMRLCTAKSQRFAIFPCSWVIFSNLGIFLPPQDLVSPTIENFYVATSIPWARALNTYFPESRSLNEARYYSKLRRDRMLGSSIWLIVNVVNGLFSSGDFSFDNNDRFSILPLIHLKFGGIRASMGVLSFDQSNGLSDWPPAGPINMSEIKTNKLNGS